MKSKSLAICPECRQPLAVHGCSGAEGLYPKGGCREPRDIRLKRFEENRAKQRQDPAYQKHSARLTRKRLTRLAKPQQQINLTKRPLQRLRHRIEAATVTAAQAKRVPVVPIPPPETLGHASWQTREEKCKTKEGRSLRGAVLEWLRLESLRLARPSLTETQQRECAPDFAQIDSGAYHRLLTGECLPSEIVIYNELPQRVKRLSPVTELRAKRFLVLDEEKQTRAEKTLIVPDLDDPDPTRLGDLLPTRLCLSIDIRHAKIQEEVLAYVQRARHALAATRGEGAGRPPKLVSMAEALRLWEKQKQSPATKKEIGFDAQHFGTHNQLGVKADRVLDLAARMIEAATAGPAVWRQTFR